MVESFFQRKDMSAFEEGLVLFGLHVVAGRQNFQSFIQVAWIIQVGNDAIPDPDDFRPICAILLQAFSGDVEQIIDQSGCLGGGEDWLGTLNRLQRLSGIWLPGGDRVDRSGSEYLWRFIGRSINEFHVAIAQSADTERP